MGFDGSAIDGFARVQEADMIARPDASTGVLGERLFEWFIANKRAGWDGYATYITGLEPERNLPRL